MLALVRGNCVVSQFQDYYRDLRFLYHIKWLWCTLRSAETIETYTVV